MLTTEKIQVIRQQTGYAVFSFLHFCILFVGVYRYVCTEVRARVYKKITMQSFLTFCLWTQAAKLARQTVTC